ncbi:MAG: TilS substrate-binding domain-containing protein [Nocardioides sp.]|nr:TilS substrate-binding domain-containing protein [Nocardioides sp.]
MAGPVHQRPGSTVGPLPADPPDTHFTIVSFHAHPDDEALLTSGTLARAAADGHRVIVVVATAGEAGLAREDWAADDLGSRRMAELLESARAIGAARVEVLGHPDSGWGGSAPAGADPDASLPFSRMDVEPLAVGLAALLSQEAADVLTVYDENGGYGHPDHVQVHRVGVRAAELAHTPIVLEATVDRDALGRSVRALRRLARVAALPDLPNLSTAYQPRAAITHRVDVGRHLGAKVAALRAHASQSTDAAGSNARTLALLLRLPPPLRRRVLRYEWFTERGRPPTGVMLDDIFASLRAEGGNAAGEDDHPKGLRVDT